jgi:hypothetical protein
MHDLSRVHITGPLVPYAAVRARTRDLRPEQAAPYRRPPITAGDMFCAEATSTARPPPHGRPLRLSGCRSFTYAQPGYESPGRLASWKRSVGVPLRTLVDQAKLTGPGWAAGSVR